MQRRELGDEREPDARPGHSIGGCTAIEDPEDRLPMLVGNAWAVVVHGDEDAAVARLDADRDPRPRRGVIDGVRQEVLDDPFDLGSIDVGDDMASFDVDRMSVRVRSDTTCAASSWTSVGRRFGRMKP